MKPKYSALGESFIIDNYNAAPAFSNFFPGLAGVRGKPLWVFYTNRGQGIAGFGINNKDGAMMEFLPANKAYQATPLLGFRTFIQAKGADAKIHELFQVHENGSQQTMVVRPYELELRDKHPSLGIEATVSYFGVPNENHPVLARSLSIKNTSSKPLTLHVVDGLPRVIPWGMNDFLAKNMSRTIEAFAEVTNLKSKVPFFKLKIEPSDRPEIRWLDDGFFSFTVLNGEFIAPIVDASVLFGADTSFQKPQVSLDRIKANGKQLTSNILPSALAISTVVIAPKQSKEWTSYYGYAESADHANQFAESVKSKADYYESKRAEMREVYEHVVHSLSFISEREDLNQYARVTFMDNVLRGGFPMAFGPTGPIAHVFSRKHGDMERDYNAFQVSATYYSQGNGNFRDVNQNRRNDLFFNPKVGTVNLDTFFNLLQLDGYNPLVINPVRFIVPKDVLNKIDLQMSDRCRTDYMSLLRQPALAGQIYEFIKKYALDPLNVNNDFREVMSSSIPQQVVQHGEGFWTDHWTYNLDHLDLYLGLFPDKNVWVLYEKNDFTFYDSDHFVRPRREKYIVTSDKKLRQYNAVVHNPQKEELMRSRATQQNKVRTEAGQGEILQVNLFTKLLALAVVKTSSLDPYGVGIEMDADKPGWCDALNGLPGLCGSSSHEMFELKRLVNFLIDKVLPISPNKAVDIPSELYSFMRDIEEGFELDNGKDFVPAWDRMASAREQFRERTFMGVSGKTRNIRIIEIRTFLTKTLNVLNRAAKRAMDPKTGMPTSYFAYDVDASQLSDGWRQFLGKLPWKQHRVASFLEGPVHALKSATPGDARKIYNAVKKSDLYDSKLGMYRLNVPLDAEPNELGRAKVFSRGWLENESIFLHMHYKYLLELLKAGMTETFLKELESGGLVAFRDPEVYGRPVFENSSFIASSAFPDPEYHGRGFVARLSGATSEFLSMLYFMFFGFPPFKKDENGMLVFAPQPNLPRDWFTKADHLHCPKNGISIRLFDAPVTFVNEKRKNTFGPGAVKPAEYEWILDGRFYRHSGRELTPDASLALREGRLERLTIYLK